MHGRRAALALGLAATAALVASLAASATIPVLQIATDPFTNSTSQHKTVVEPDSFFFGSTGVVAAQAGRFTDGGASGIVFARSIDNGVSYTSGTLPGITVFQNPPGPFARVSDPSVAHDRKHGVWMVSSLGLDSSIRGTAVIVNRSTNGGATWGNPVTVRAAGSTNDFDKNWTVCDNTTTSPFFGRCYTVWDDFANGNSLQISFSTDGGLTWNRSGTPNTGVIGGQPVVQPNGNVVVPLDNASETALGSTISTNGGASFGAVTTITNITAKVDPGGIRSGPLPSAEIAGDGRIFVVWEDCRFRASCDERPRLRHLDERDDVLRRSAHPDRPHDQHRRPLHPGRRRRPEHVGLDHEGRGDLLLLPGRELHVRHVLAPRRLHLVLRRRRELAPVRRRRGTDGAGVASEYDAGPDGRGLHLDLVQRQLAGARLLRRRQPAHVRRERLRDGDPQLRRVAEHVRVGPVVGGRDDGSRQRPGALHGEGPAGPLGLQPPALERARGRPASPASRYPRRMAAHDPYVLPEGLPVPADDGAADHLPGLELPDLTLPSSSGPVDLAELARERLVLYVYPRTGKPGRPMLPGWDDIPGARGCTPQSCGFRDHAAELAAFGARVAGLSAQRLADQIEFAERTRMPYPVVSDERLELAAALGLPTFEVEGLTLYRRLALVAEEGRVVKVFYPVFPPDRNAEEVLAWLRARAD
jgi:peroxiredoxin